MEYPIVLIKWLDSATTGGWRKEDDEGIKPTICFSIGFLLPPKETDSASPLPLVNIAQSLSDRGYIGDTISIPKSCILEMKKLRKDKGLEITI